MNGIIEVEILGQKRVLVFNNYARVEISKILGVDPASILDSIQNIINENYLLLIKTLVYAGHVGDCYRRQDTTDLTRDQVAQWIGDAAEEDLYHIFDAFMKAEGFGMDSSETDKKKANPRVSRTKKQAGKK